MYTYKCHHAARVLHVSLRCASDTHKPFPMSLLVDCLVWPMLACSRHLLSTLSPFEACLKPQWGYLVPCTRSTYHVPGMPRRYKISYSYCNSTLPRQVGWGLWVVLPAATKEARRQALTSVRYLSPYWSVSLCAGKKTNGVRRGDIFF